MFLEGQGQGDNVLLASPSKMSYHADEFQHIAVTDVSEKKS